MAAAAALIHTPVSEINIYHPTLMVSKVVPSNKEWALPKPNYVFLYEGLF
jgi:hypothetical protein